MLDVFVNKLYNSGGAEAFLTSCINSDEVLQYQKFFSFLLFTCNYLEILVGIYRFKSL